MAKTKVTIRPLKINLDNIEGEILEKIGQRIVETAVETGPSKTGNYKSQIAYDGANAVIAKAKYSAAIEYGFNNYEETVNEHERVITQAFGKKITPVIATIKTHTRTMNRKPNPVMRNAAAKVQKETQQIVNKILKSRGFNV